MEQERSQQVSSSRHEKDAHHAAQEESLAECSGEGREQHMISPLPVFGIGCLNQCLCLPWSVLETPTAA